MRRALWLVALGAVTTALGATVALGAPTIEQEMEPRTDFVTPHTRWAKPYVGGTTKVLFFSDYRGTKAREIVELMQRFDIAADVAIFLTIVDTTNTQWHGGEEGIDRIRRLIETGEHDVYLFNQVTVDKLPTELQFKLVQRVADGAGLVLVGVDDKRVLKRPRERNQVDDPDADLFDVRRGRAARLPAPPVIPYAFGWETQYDYWQERLGHTVLWAGGKLRQTAVRRELPRMRTPAAPGQAAEPRPERPFPPGSRMWVRVRRDDGLLIGEEERPAEELALGIAAPNGRPAGKYHADVVLRDAQGRVLDWATEEFEIGSPRTVSLDVPKPWVEVGESIRGEVKLAGQTLTGERVVVELRDRRGRILASAAPMRQAENVVPFTFAVPEWTPMLVQVRAVVRDANGEAADAAAYVNVVKRHRNQFNFLVWDTPGGATGPYAEQALAELGMTLQLNGSNPPPVVAAHDVAYVPYTTRIMDDKDANGHTKPVPWNQEPEIDQYVQGIADKYLPSRQHGVFVYSLGDETVTRGSDVSPSDLAAYRRYLQAVYGTIAALNASWGTDYEGFEAITLLDPKDPKEQQAKRDGNFARWYDRQAWECDNFLNLCRRFGEAYRRMDPQARTGFEGAGRLDAGDDLDGFVRVNGFWSPYPGPADQVLRGIAPRDFPRSNWMGYTKDADPLCWSYWRMVLNGCDSVWWWRWDNVGRFMGLLRPDLSVFDEVKELFEDTRVTREGLGDLLLNAEMQDDGIALLYSHPSAYAAEVADGPSYGNFAAAHAAWHQTLFNLGLSFRYVTDDMLREGALDPAKIRVLILPRAEALSDEDAAAITRFAEAGGTVIADLRPGRFDGRCKPRAAGVLDALFGVDTSSSAAAKPDVELSFLVDPKVAMAPWAFTKQTVDAGVKATGATALGRAGEAPVLLTRAAGKGRAVLLNWSMLPFPRPGQPQAPRGTDQWLPELLAPAGVQPAFALARDDGAPQGDLHVQRWRTGQIELVGLMKEPDKAGSLMGFSQREGGAAAEFTLTLPEARYVYDLRAGQPLGRQTSVKLLLRPSRATFLVLSPTELSPVAAALSARRVRRGETPTLDLRAPGTPGAAAAMVTAQRPDGSAADWMRTVRVVPAAGGVSVPLPVALNDPAGIWRVRVKDVYTGRVSETSLTVDER